VALKKLQSKKTMKRKEKILKWLRNRVDTNSGNSITNWHLSDDILEFIDEFYDGKDTSVKQGVGSFNRYAKMLVEEGYLCKPEKIGLESGGYIEASWIKNMQGIPNGCIKEMARIFLKITDVRVERLQDIGYDKISLEGFDVAYKDCSGLSYEERRFDWWIDLWNKTAQKGYKWNNNPYVFVYEFERVNIDGTPYKRKAR
jgi:hypothetical protein